MISEAGTTMLCIIKMTVGLLHKYCQKNTFPCIEITASCGEKFLTLLHDFGRTYSITVMAK